MSQCQCYKSKQERGIRCSFPAGSDGKYCDRYHSKGRCHDPPDWLKLSQPKSEKDIPPGIVPTQLRKVSQPKEHKKMSLLDLGPTQLREISRYLPHKDVVNFARTSKKSHASVKPQLQERFEHPSVVIFPKNVSFDRSVQYTNDRVILPNRRQYTIMLPLAHTIFGELHDPAGEIHIDGPITLSQLMKRAREFYVSKSPTKFDRDGYVKLYDLDAVHKPRGLYRIGEYKYILLFALGMNYDEPFENMILRALRLPEQEPEEEISDLFGEEDWQPLYGERPNWDQIEQPDRIIIKGSGQNKFRLINGIYDGNVDDGYIISGESPEWDHIKQPDQIIVKGYEKNQFIVIDGTKKVDDVDEDEDEDEDGEKELIETYETIVMRGPITVRQLFNRLYEYYQNHQDLLELLGGYSTTLEEIVPHIFVLELIS